MMKKFVGAAGAALLVFSLVPTVASASSPARVVTDLNVRAGPGTQYPAVVVFPGGSRVDVIGCTSGTTWCDVSGRGVRGWVSARYLEFDYRGDRLVGPAYGARVALPVVTFQIGNYWDNHYRGRSWYDQRSRFDRRPDRVLPREEFRRAPVLVEPAPARTQRWEQRRGDSWDGPRDGRRGDRWDGRRDDRRDGRDERRRSDRWEDRRDR